MDLSTGKYWDVSWSPIRGCSHASPGCDHCWAERMAGRFCGESQDPRIKDTGAPFYGFATKDGWTGSVELIESELVKPLHWKKPRIIALNWMGDLFHEKVSDEAIDRVFAVMALCPQHRFLVLTKRAKRMREYLEALGFGFIPSRISAAAIGLMSTVDLRRLSWSLPGWPLPNLALGVSCEDQERADERIPGLLATPAAMRWVSLGPLLGPVNLIQSCDVALPPDYDVPVVEGISHKLHWVITEGESGPGGRPCGPGVRPMPPEWPRKVRDGCKAVGVPYFHKQNGEWAPTFINDTNHGKMPEFRNVPVGDGTHHRMFRVGKKAAGRLLDGRTWDELPEMLRRPA